MYFEYYYICTDIKDIERKTKSSIDPEILTIYSLQSKNSHWVGVKVHVIPSIQTTVKTSRLV